MFVDLRDDPRENGPTLGDERTMLVEVLVRDERRPDLRQFLSRTSSKNRLNTRAQTAKHFDIQLGRLPLSI